MANVLTKSMIASKAFRTLTRHARTLPPVRDFYRGWAVQSYWGPRLAENLLLFSVTDPRRLGAARTIKAYHHRYVLVVPLSGRAIVEIDAAAYDLQPGQVLLIRPFQLHDYRQVRGQAFCWLFITFELPTGLEGWDKGVRRLPPEAIAWLQTLVTWRRRYRDQPPPPIRRSATLALTLLLTQLAAQTDRPGVATPKPRTTDYWLESLLSRIQKTTRPSPSIASLSRECGISASHLRAMFRARFGVSLGRYLRDYRIKRAISLLRVPATTVTHAAELCGYSSIYSFSRAFRRTMGCSPTQYLQRLST